MILSFVTITVIDVKTAYSLVLKQTQENVNTYWLAMTERYSKHLIRLYIGDYDLLARLRPDERPNKIIRELIHKYIERLALIKAGGKVDGNDS